MKRDLDNRDPAARLKPKRPNLAEPKSPTEVSLRDSARRFVSGRSAHGGLGREHLKHTGLLSQLFVGETYAL
jgi:hypothetical protein